MLAISIVTKVISEKEYANLMTLPSPYKQNVFKNIKINNKFCFILEIDERTYLSGHANR